MNLKKRIASLGLVAAVMFTSVFGGEAAVVKADTIEFERVGHLEFDTETSEYGLLSATREGVMDGEGVEEVDSKYALLKTPSAYCNSRAQANAKFPATRDQNPYGTCWAFSSIAMVEFNMITQGLADKTVDYSELQLAHFTYNNVTDPLGGTKGDLNRCSYYEGYLQMGGNRYASSRTLATWQGVADEKTVPYEVAGSYEFGGLDSKFAYNADVTRIKNAYLIPFSTSNLSAVKNAIMKYGSVGMDYCAGYGDVMGQINFNNETIGTYWFPVDPKKVNDSANHAVTIVGWDDSFPASGFSYSGSEFGFPEGNGAWLVRNSWTTNPDDEEGMGYFWLSYYDKSMIPEVWAFEMEPVNNHYHNYQYDGSYFVEGLKADGAAVVFTAKDNEIIDAVSVSNWYVNGDIYNVDVYTGVKDEKKPTSGTKASSVKATVAVGQQQIALKTPVAVKKGEKFAIVVKTASKAYCVEDDYITYDSWYTDVTASGHSYLLSEKEWYNTKGLSLGGAEMGDVAIKALTVKGGTVAKPKAPTASSKKSKQLTVKFKKVSGAKGYDIQVATDKNFKKNLKKASTSKTSYTFKGLKKGKKYYVRIRAYKKISGAKVTSSWVKAKKTVKVK